MLGYPSGRGMGAVGRTEGVIHIGIRQLGQLLREGRIVLLLTLVEPDVLQEQHVPILQGIHYLLGFRAGEAAAEHDVLI